MTIQEAYKNNYNISMSYCNNLWHWIIITDKNRYESNIGYKIPGDCEVSLITYIKNL